MPNVKHVQWVCSKCGKKETRPKGERPRPGVCKNGTIHKWVVHHEMQC